MSSRQAHNKARITADVHTLCAYPDRVVGSAGHAAAREFARQRLTDLALEPLNGKDLVLPYDTHFANVAGVIPAADNTNLVGPRALNPVVIGAHYDTVPGTPGADDNAAAVAVVFEVASRLVSRPPARPIVVAIFDAEEPPYFHTQQMGSIRFVEDQLGRNAHAAVILDLIANRVRAPGLEAMVGIMGCESHPGWAEIVRPVARKHGPVLTLPNSLMPDMSDHYAFRLASRPYLFLSAGQGQHYHQPTDTPDNADLSKAARVADMVEELVRGVAATTWNGAQPHDTSLLDYERLGELVGYPQLEQMGVGSARDSYFALQRLLELV